MLALLLIVTDGASGQTILLSEDFSGFTTGSHTTPSTFDASSVLDQKTCIPGWHGSLIYSAGGEIKIGTGSSSGWIETPPLDLSANTGIFTLSFSIARWQSDATTVQVYVDGMIKGDIITPVEAWSKITMALTGGTTSSRIKVQGVTKRFFVDSLVVTADIPTRLDDLEKSRATRIWPVPARDELNIEDPGGISQAMIIDLNGRVFRQELTVRKGRFTLNLADLHPGFYLLILQKDKGDEVLRFVKIQ